MNKILSLLIIFILISNCSLQKNRIWTQNKKIETEKEIIINELFKDEDALSKEFNSNIKIRLKSKPLDNAFVVNLNNNNGKINFKGNLKNVSRYKYKKIDNFDQFEPEIAFDKDQIIFFDNKGSIIKFDQHSKIIWKKNYYKRSERKSKPILFFSNNNKTLIIVDNLAKYYAVNLDNGELLWMKNNVAPFNSQIKIYKDKFFVVDFENTLRCYSLKNGNECWNVKTDTTFIKSQKKLSVIILNNIVYFINSIGDISGVDIETGNLIWQTPTQSSSIYEDAFLLKTSDMIGHKKLIFFSNNKNEFFSFDATSGVLNWKQKINSNLRPSLTENLIFSVTVEGFLVIMDSQNGNILRITNIFDKIKKKKRSKIKPVGFILGRENVYLTTDNGLLIIIDIVTGRSSSILKIDNEKISRPFILKNNMFIIKDNAVIKLN